jgi:CubicO group peptidase (beta-lactamase class C family)
VLPEGLATKLEVLVRTVQNGSRVPSVSAAVFRDGQVVWELAIGTADIGHMVPATPQHAYRIGSITKTFTAVGVMQLRDAGRLDLDAPVASVVEQMPPGPTIRQALSHLSGLQREPPGNMWETMIPPTRSELLAGLAEAERVAAPGTLFHYSNLVFAIMGEVVARAGGSTYEDYLRERVLDPLGLARTRMRPEDPAAVGYYVDPFSDDVHLEPDPPVTETTGAAGWLWSTTGDLARFGDFVCTGREGVLSRDTMDEMARVETMVDGDRWTLGWGLGLELYRRGDRVLVGHGGAMPGFLACVAVHRAERTGAAVLMNTSAHAAPETLALDLATASLDAFEREPPVWAPGTVPEEVKPLLGLWWTEGEEIVVSFRDGRLQADLVHGPAGRKVSYFERETETVWRCVEGRERGERLETVRNVTGVVDKLYFATYPMTRNPSTFGSL